jgi:hypothetical protein
MTGVILYNVILILIASNKYSKTGATFSLAPLEAEIQTFKVLPV